MEQTAVALQIKLKVQAYKRQSLRSLTAASVFFDSCPYPSIAQSCVHVAGLHDVSDRNIALVLSRVPSNLRSVPRGYQILHLFPHPERLIQPLMIA